MQLRGVLGLHPLNEQCTAKAKATGERCRRRVVGTTVCWVHGSAAKQVRQKQQERLMVYEAEVAAAAEPTVMREPEEILLDALHDTNAVLTRIKADLHSGVVNPILLDLCGDWLDRLGRLGRVVTDGDLSRKLYDRVGVQAQDLASQLTAMLAAIVAESPLSARDRLALWQSRFDGLQAVADGRAPARMLGDATTRFTDGLMEAAAREQAVAEGSPWGEDSSESDEELDEVGSLVLFPSFDGNGFRG